MRIYEGNVGALHKFCLRMKSYLLYAYIDNNIKLLSEFSGLGSPKRNFYESPRSVKKIWEQKGMVGRGVTHCMLQFIV